MEQKVLTKKQKRVYDFIVKFINENEYAPTIREVAKGLNLSSPATVYSHIEALRNKGYLEDNKRGTRILKIADKSKPTYKELEKELNKKDKAIKETIKVIKECLMLGKYEFDWEEQMEYVLKEILERDNKDEN